MLQSRVVPRQRPKHEKKTPMQQLLWKVYLNGRVFEIVAYTRGEARAQVKASLGLDRLPVETEITCEGFHTAA
jgi:hypothetical protein